MIEFANTLFPNLPDSLNWVYGVVYIFMAFIFLILLILPFIIVISIIRHRKRRF